MSLLKGALILAAAFTALLILERVLPKVPHPHPVKPLERGFAG
jgi:hypothetical protein